MANGPGTAELVAAVTGAGGLGVFGASGLTCAALERDMARVRELAPDGPFGVNAQLAPPTPATGERERILEVMRPFRRELGLPDEPPEPAKADPPAALIECALAGGATVVTTFDDPSAVADATRAAGARLVAMVTTADEARTALASGAEAIIAQGSEAGGHRGTFGGGEARGGGIVALVPQVVDAVGPDIPVVASGGIMDGRGIAAALALGAQGVSLGTCFLGQRRERRRGRLRRDAPRHARRPDGRDRPRHRPARRAGSATASSTRSWRPIPARSAGAARRALVSDLRRAASEQDRGDILPMLAGEGAAMSGERRRGRRARARPWLAPPGRREARARRASHVSPEQARLSTLGSGTHDVVRADPEVLQSSRRE